MEFKPDELVVHPRYGIGCVVRLAQRQFGSNRAQEYYEISIGSGTIWVPAGVPGNPYERYALTSTGISPMQFPPLQGEVIRVNSHVHDPDGITTEDPEITKAMADKRLKKEQLLKQEIENLHPVTVAGDPEGTTALLCWGSCKGICTEVGSRLGVRVIQPIVLSPFPEQSFADAVQGVERLYTAEVNETGQLARLVHQFGYRTSGTVLKYDGRPFIVEDLEDELRKVIQ